MGIRIIDLAAIVGAAAWLPPLLKLLARRQIRFIPASTTEIGYSLLGPIINITFSISAAKKEALIEKIDLDITHESNTQASFSWQLISEIPFETQSSSGEVTFFTKNQGAAALKIPVSILIDRKIGFQSSSFLKRKINALNGIQDKEVHLSIIKNPDLPDSLFKEKEWTDFEQFLRSEFFWKQGRYEATLRAFESSEKKPFLEKYSFELSKSQILMLERNIELALEGFKNSYYLSYKKISKLPSLQLNWIYPDIYRE